jgi:hypothetical protein
MTDSRSVERVEKIKYLGTAATNQNSNHEEIKSRSKSGKCLLLFGVESFVFQFANQKYKDKDRNVILLLSEMGVKLGPLHSRRNVGWGCLRMGC